MQLSQNQLDRYHEDGFLIVRDFFIAARRIFRTESVGAWTYVGSGLANRLALKTSRSAS